MMKAISMAGRLQDLKTGRDFPEGSLKDEVNRQLCMYRDILKANNTEYPEIITQDGIQKMLVSGKAQGLMSLKTPLSAGSLHFRQRFL